VRGAISNGRPYRDNKLLADNALTTGRRAAALAN
jgi:hypothetical protein